ncbi:MAG: hypothetical protein ABH821_03005 [archaeon]
MDYMKSVRAHFGNENIFSKRDLVIFLSKKRINKDYTQLIIHNLLKKQEIQRITRGQYTFKNDLEVAGFAFSPFYYGLQDALSIRNLWEQETNPVIITPRKVRKGLRTIMDSNVLIRTINRKMFFGYEIIKYGDYWLPVSDSEKTLIDFVYYKEPLSREVLKEIKKNINVKKLNSYLKRTPKHTATKIKKLI